MVSHAVASEPAGSQQAVEAPTSRALPRHILKRFDFDERADGNYEQTPMYWSRREGPSLPYYNDGGFDWQVGARGCRRSSCMRPPKVSRLANGRNDIPVEPGNRYQVTAYIRAQGLCQDEAYISAAYMSRGMEVLPGTEVFSGAIGADESDGQWHRVEIATSESPRQARFLQITVWLTQPESAAGGKPGRAAVDRQAGRGCIGVV